MTADPSLASTLRAVVEARKATSKGRDTREYIKSAFTALDWVESHGEAAAAALERAQAVEDDLRWALEHIDNAELSAEDDARFWRVYGALRTALEGRST